MHYDGPVRRTVISISMLVAGCGRIGFSPTPSDDAGGDGPGDGGDPCAVVDTGLLGAWSLDAEDVQGGIVHDGSGRGHHGTLVGAPGPVVVPGRIGDALDFSATSLAWVDLASVPLDSTAGGFTTVSLWLWRDDPAADEGVVCLPTGPVPGPPRYSLWLTNRSGPPSLCINTGVGDCWGIIDPGVIGRWVHVAIVYANGRTIDGQLYVDGAPVVMGCRFGTCDQTRVAMSPLSLGCSDPTYAWRGRLDEVRVFDRALSATEVRLLHDCAP
jgi:hypothetical protein